MNRLSMLMGASLCGLLAGMVHAQSISASDVSAGFKNAPLNPSYSLAGSSPLQARPLSSLKTQDGYTGIGAQGATVGEIDWRGRYGEPIALDLTNDVTSACGVQGNGACAKQPSNHVESVLALPEPQPYALLLAAVGAVGFIALRRGRGGSAI